MESLAERTICMDTSLAVNLAVCLFNSGFKYTLSVLFKKENITAIYICPFFKIKLDKSVIMNFSNDAERPYSRLKQLIKGCLKLLHFLFKTQGRNQGIFSYFVFFTNLRLVNFLTCYMSSMSL